MKLYQSCNNSNTAKLSKNIRLYKYTLSSQKIKRKNRNIAGISVKNMRIPI